MYRVLLTVLIPAVLSLGWLHADAGAESPGISARASVAGAAARSESPEFGRHALYAELFGKGGLYSLGYDYQLHPRVAAGSAVALYWIHDQRVLSISPYLGWYPLSGRNHRWFVHTGAQVLDLAVASPVPQWNGARTASVGAQLASGYEYRGRVLVRVAVMAVAGTGGIVPWAGTSVGMAL
ncbi:MAG: hypothetical protein AAGC55_10955 [Myxococcota bacterium]